MYKGTININGVQEIVVSSNEYIEVKKQVLHYLGLYITDEPQDITFTIKELKNEKDL